MHNHVRPPRPVLVRVGPLGPFGPRGGSAWWWAAMSCHGCRTGCRAVNAFNANFLARLSDPYPVDGMRAVSRSHAAGRTRFQWLAVLAHRGRPVAVSARALEKSLWHALPSARPPHCSPQCFVLLLSVCHIGWDGVGWHHITTGHILASLHSQLANLRLATRWQAAAPGWPTPTDLRHQHRHRQQQTQPRLQRLLPPVMPP